MKEELGGEGCREGGKGGGGDGAPAGGGGASIQDWMGLWRPRKEPARGRCELPLGHSDWPRSQWDEVGGVKVQAQSKGTSR